MAPLLLAWTWLQACRCQASLTVPAVLLLLLLLLLPPRCCPQEKVLTPQQVSGLESLLVPPAAAVLEWAAGRPQGSVVFGARLTPLLCGSGSVPQGAVLQRLCDAQPPAAGRQYVLCLVGAGRRRRVHVVVHTRAEQQAQLAAYLTALHLAGTLQQASTGLGGGVPACEHACWAAAAAVSGAAAEPAAAVAARTCAQAAGDDAAGATLDDAQLLAASQQWASKRLPQFLAALGQHGWELEKLYLPRPQFSAEW